MHFLSPCQFPICLCIFPYALLYRVVEVVGQVWLGQLLCGSLTDAPDSSLLRLAISPTEVSEECQQPTFVLTCEAQQLPRKQSLRRNRLLVTQLIGYVAALHLWRFVSSGQTKIRHVSSRSMWLGMRVYCLTASTPPPSKAGANKLAMRFVVMIWLWLRFLSFRKPPPPPPAARRQQGGRETE